MTARVRPPEPAGELREGFEYAWAEMSNGWRLLHPTSNKRCRAHSGPRTPACGKRSVAELNRGRRGSYGEVMENWWAYCPEHLYGRTIEDGKLMAWVIRRVEPS